MKSQHFLGFLIVLSILLTSCGGFKYALQGKIQQREQIEQGKMSRKEEV